jgi:hypothetical protein
MSIGYAIARDENLRKYRALLQEAHSLARELDDATEVRIQMLRILDGMLLYVY